MGFWRGVAVLGLSVLVLSISACQPIMWPRTHMKRYFETISPELRYARMEPMNHWRAQGVVTINCYSNCHVQPMSVALFRWKNLSRESYQLRLESVPMQGYDINLDVVYRDVLVWRDFKYPFHVKNPRVYMQQELGWSLPFKSVPYWLRGIPGPGPFVAHYNHYGLIDTLQQQGFTICYQTYTDMDGYDMPRTMTIAGQGILLQITFNHWETLFLNRSVPSL